MNNRYFILFKPFGFLSQFTSQHKAKKTLSDVEYNFPKDVYPVGRLDEDSEGLLFLTNDKPLNFRLLSPEFKHSRTYWSQVDGEITDEACHKLCSGVEIAVEQKKYFTLPAEAKKIAAPINIAERIPPVRFRKNIPTSWIELKLMEGKNRQVRKMTAAVGFPTLRLIRAAIENLSIENMNAGEVKELSKEEVYEKLLLK